MKKIFTFLMIAALAAVAWNCSKDDEPDPATPDGVSIYLNAVETLYTSDAKPAFTPTKTPGLYIAVAASAEVSRNYIARLIGNEGWDGKDTTVNLGENGESGTIRVVGQTDSMKAQGIFNEIIVNIKDYEPFTLQIIDEERAKDDNTLLEDGYTGEGVATIR